MPAYVERPGTLEAAQHMGLLPSEFESICELLGRTPNFTELSIYAVMWSEHCSYKNSIHWLKQLPKDGPAVLAGAGEENAGLLDIGDGLAVAFKIESHNHPSALEPFQGAATGVGGIHRDIFTLGARPIATLNSLRFGDPTLERTRHLLQGVVNGIAHYGNSFGVPTVGGEIDFDPCYNTNPLVNAMSVGIVKVGETISATARGIGNPVMIVGSETGKDGIHGASFASEDISADSVDKLPAVQVGDPFAEKKLLEATLEVIQTGAVVGMQDMGAAGITCSTAEMSAKGGVSMRIDLDKVPMRQDDMLPFEVLLSESQERMLLVVEKGREAEVTRIFDKWDLPAVPIGEVTEGNLLHYYWHGELVAQVPASTLDLGGEGVPVYIQPQKIPSYFTEIERFNPNTIPAVTALKPVLESLLQTPSIASKRRVQNQYDATVGNGTLTHSFPASAALVRIPGTQKAVGITTDCNSRYVYLNPRQGTALALAEACRNLVCSGARPIGVTNCLNFGNPYNPEVYYQFAESVLGLKEACEAFNLPVTGGNVSLYNQSSDDGPVFPTPTIGVVGILEDVQKRLGLAWQTGDALYLLGEPSEDIGGSAYVYHYHSIRYSTAPELDLAAEVRLQELILKLNEAGLLRAANDVSDGGLLVTLAESAFPEGVGIQLTTPVGTVRKDAFWFGEAGGRVVIAVAAQNAQTVRAQAEQAGIPMTPLGTVTGGDMAVDGEQLGSTEALNVLWANALERKLYASSAVQA